MHCSGVHAVAGKLEADPHKTRMRATRQSALAILPPAPQFRLLPPSALQHNSLLSPDDNSPLRGRQVVDDFELEPAGAPVVVRVVVRHVGVAQLQVEEVNGARLREQRACGRRRGQAGPRALRWGRAAGGGVSVCRSAASFGSAGRQPPRHARHLAVRHAFRDMRCGTRHALRRGTGRTRVQLPAARAGRARRPPACHVPTSNLMALPKGIRKTRISSGCGYLSTLPVGAARATYLAGPHSRAGV